ncbi:alpha/beta hydrolase family protein [Arcticibacterium luteifluviistationis]|uniref:alpha/beta hydrolase family protein n=1 Tax=Arcticibacterium luteifluviistationis TaxID=1784714 RepID=UPI0013A69750|nr:alpha/beta hydrolase [Arcticibacterium luteifluviistationis]
MVYIEKQNISLLTSDGIELSATLLAPENPKALIQFNSATAVPKEFYRALATYFGEKKYACLLYDYRGVCDSQPKEGLKNCEYDLLDWGKKDMAAGISFLKNRYPDLPLFFISHSVGGQLIPFVPNIDEVNGMVCVATSSGYRGGMPLSKKLNSLLFFDIIAPIVHLLYGFSKLKFLGVMEDMPKNVTNTWKRWCKYPDYFYHPDNAKDIPELSNPKVFNFPITVITATDDDICTAQNVENLWRNVKTKTPVDFKWLKPEDFNLKGIGHFNFFRRRKLNTLWPIAFNQIEKYYEQNRN